MNHLFATVDGMAVEPGAYINPVDDRWFSMRKYWGDGYNPVYDKDVTVYLPAIREAKFKWIR
jgi:hypothetical protein